jgi:ComF family protein
MERCLACGGALACAGGDWRGPVCASCRSRLELIAGRRCRTCSRQLISETERCTRCRNRDYAFTCNTSLAAYTGTARRLLYHYKFKARTRLADLFAEALADAGLVDRESCVVPVPARPRGLLQRAPTRFDQTGLIARRLRRRTGCTVHNALRRSAGPPQKRLDYDARSRNVAGRIRPVTPAQLPDRVVLLDDVFTTGATAHECALVLARCGVRETRVVTVALG